VGLGRDAPATGEVTAEHHGREPAVGGYPLDPVVSPLQQFPGQEPANGHDAVVDLQNHYVVGYSDCHSWLSLDREVRQTRTSAIGTTAVRNWAREQGIDIKDRGRVPADIVAKYEAATGW
jgi:hypothetical protein